MQAIKCELCGSNQLIKKDGFFQCEFCGTKYTPEEARKLFVSGTVSVEGDVKTKDADFIVKAGKLEKYNGASPIVVIPEGVRAIGDSCFEGLRIESVVMPDSVKEIGTKAFAGCTSLASVQLSENLEIIGKMAFSECEKITSVDIPKSVTAILGGAFRKCRGLTSIIIPENVKEIGLSSNAYQYELDSYTYYMSALFADCDHLTTVTILGTDISIGSIGGQNLSEVIIKGNVELIEKGAFSYYKNLTTVIIEGNVKLMEGDVFHDCPNLTSICIDGVVEIIGKSWQIFPKSLDYEKCRISPENRSILFRGAAEKGYCACCLHKLDEVINKYSKKKEYICPNCEKRRH